MSFIRITVGVSCLCSGRGRRHLQGHEPVAARAQPGPRRHVGPCQAAPQVAAQVVDWRLGAPSWLSLSARRHPQPVTTCWTDRTKTTSQLCSISNFFIFPVSLFVITIFALFLVSYFISYQLWYSRVGAGVPYFHVQDNIVPLSLALITFSPFLSVFKYIYIYFSFSALVGIFLPFYIFGCI